MSKNMVSEDFFNTLIDFNQLQPILYSDIKYEWSEIELLITNSLMNRNTSDTSVAYTPTSSLLSSFASPTDETPELLLDSWDDQSDSCCSGSPTLPCYSSFSPLLQPIESSFVEVVAISPGITTTTASAESRELMPAYNKKKTFKCESCYRYFARRHDLERHVRIHTGAKPYVCPCCQKSFSRSDARNRHFRSDPTCSFDERVKKSLRTKRKS